MLDRGAEAEEAACVVDGEAEDQPGPPVIVDDEVEIKNGAAGGDADPVESVTGNVSAPARRRTEVHQPYTEEAQSPAGTPSVVELLRQAIVQDDGEPMRLDSHRAAELLNLLESQRDELGELDKNFQDLREDLIPYFC